MALRLIRDLPGDRRSCPRVATTRKARCAGHQHRDARTTRFRRAHRAVRPHDDPCCSYMRPPHPALNVRDDRDAPLSPRRDRDGYTRFPKKRKRNLAGERPHDRHRFEGEAEINVFERGESAVRRGPRSCRVMSSCSIAQRETRDSAIRNCASDIVDIGGVFVRPVMSTDRQRWFAPQQSCHVGLALAKCHRVGSGRELVTVMSSKSSLASTYSCREPGDTRARVGGPT